MSNTRSIKPFNTVAISLCFLLGAHAPALKAAEDAHDQAKRMLQPALFITAGSAGKQTLSSSAAVDPHEQARRILQPSPELLLSHAPVSTSVSSLALINNYDGHDQARLLLQKAY